MKEIQLTKGKVALVDDEDFEYLNQFKWSANKCGNTYYAGCYVSLKSPEILLRGKKIRMHTLLLNAPKGMVVDHINQNSLDNRKSNLRIAFKNENALNSKRCNKLGYSGIAKNHSGFMARMFLNKKYIHLGTYKTRELAGLAYIEALNNLKK